MEKAMAIFSSKLRSGSALASRTARCLRCWQTALLLLCWCSLAFAASEGKPAPALHAYYREHRDQCLVLIALSMDDPKDDAKVRQMMKGYSFPFGRARDADMNGYGRIWR